MALTAVDSLSTLFLLGLKAEYAQALAMVLSWDFAVDHPVSVFETTIRVLGGLLSAWALTGDRELVEQAEGVGKKLLGAFGWQESWETRDKWDWQLPLGTVNLRTGQGSAHNDLGPHQVRIAELGTLQLEFDLLADALPEHRAAPYRSLVTFINRQIRLLETRLAVPGLWPKRLRRTVVSGPGRPGELMEHSYSVGGEVDSFYEYLLKMWVAGGGAAPGRRVEPDVAPADDLEEPAEPTGVGARDWARRMWDRSAAAMQRLMLARVMEHLACFAPGMFALGAATWPYPDGGARGEMWDWAVDSADTCFRSYWDSPTGLGCEAVSVRETPMRPMGGAYYLLRPEVLESVYYLHRLSGGADGRYRRWARFAVAALEAHAAVPSGGYTGLQDVARDPAHGVSRTETQETFFLAETLKYLWLTFASSDALDLSEWVFNTEAHPLPVRGGRRWAELMGGVGAAGKAGTAREVGAKIGARKGARKRPGVREERGRKERARERLAKLGKGKGKMGKAKARKAMRAQARNG
ncbi:glycoside hydrolase [Hyaloraphidium curvatum]|nr:glycoside hydrolase [Hyaloraphidium curvatum]